MKGNMVASQQIQPEIVAVKSYDCARKVRVSYHLPDKISDSFFEIFPDAELKIEQFSRYSPKAKDHFSMRLEYDICVNGIIDDHLLVVTYWKYDTDYPQAEINYFESRLNEAGLVDVYYTKK